MEEDSKKKRGRRPKSEKSDVKVEQKTTRKPKYVYNSIEMSDSVNNSTLSEDENVIIRLNIQKVDEDEDDTLSNDEHPYAYNCSEYGNISFVEKDDTHRVNLEPESKDNTRVLELLKDFEEKNKNNEWPSNTSISCYWCCHRFNNSPYGIPVNFKSEKFEVYGCFCSLECATAYNFKKTDSIDEMWERYNLINLMCRKLNLGNYVKPAPDVLALKMFGGHMDIERFRDHFKTNKVININFPPMTSITQQLEEINEYELNNEYKYIPIDNDRINKYKEKMIIKRSKPLINNVNSLENSMKLTYT